MPHRMRPTHGPHHDPQLFPRNALLSRATPRKLPGSTLIKDQLTTKISQNPEIL